MNPEISIVVPLFNEAPNIDELYARINRTIESTNRSFEVLITDNGSTDGTRESLIKIIEKDRRWKAAFLSRNFGHQNSLLCGLELAHGEIIISIDGDLQDPPEVILELLVQRDKGFDIVNTVRKKRPGEAFIRMTLIHIYYRLLNVLSHGLIQPNSGDFRLLSRRALVALLNMSENRPFIRGLVQMIGFASTNVYYDRDSRYAGESKMRFIPLFSFALDGITNLSILPLRLATYVGFISFVASFIYGIGVLFAYFQNKSFIPGWTTITLLLVFYGSAILFTLGIIGEYIGRIFEETKRRPRYFIENLYGEILPK